MKSGEEIINIVNKAIESDKGYLSLVQSSLVKEKDIEKRQHIATTIGQVSYGIARLQSLLNEIQ